MAAAPSDVRRERSSADAGPSTSISARARSTGAREASTAALPAPTVDDPGSPRRASRGPGVTASAARIAAPPSSSRSSRSSGIPLTTRAWPGKLRRKAWQPALVGASNGPGTKKHSRPCSSAQPAVMRAPLRQRRGRGVGEQGRAVGQPPSTHRAGRAQPCRSPGRTPRMRRAAARRTEPCSASMSPISNSESI